MYSSNMVISKGRWGERTIFPRVPLNHPGMGTPKATSDEYCFFMGVNLQSYLLVLNWGSDNISHMFYPGHINNPQFFLKNG